MDQIYSFFEMMGKKMHLIPNNYNFVTIPTNLEQPGL